MRCIGSGHIQAQSGLERRERELAGAKRAHKRMRGTGGDYLGATENNARLRGAEQLVARARDDVNAGAKRGGRGLLPSIDEHLICKQSARALVLVQ